MSDLSGQYVIWGPPGTGKTTFLALQAGKIVQQTPFRRDASSPVCVCSLTRTAASEIAGRNLPVRREQIGTLHALAYRALGHPPIAETMMQEWNQYSPGYAVDDDAVAEDPDDMKTEQYLKGEAVGTGLYADYSRFRAEMLRRENWPPAVRAFGRAWERWKAEIDCIDFTDMIEYALCDCGVAPGAPDVVIADEAQDHSRLEIELLKKWGREAGVLMLAGDPWQCLYEWRGADPLIFQDPSIPEEHIKVLSQSKRIPELVQEISTIWVKQWLSTYKKISYRPRPEPGTLDVSDATWKKPEPLVRQIVKRLEAGETVMVSATCGYMLDNLIQVCRKEGIPYCNPWRTKRGDWNPLKGGRGISMGQRLAEFLRMDKYTYPPDSEDVAMRSRMWTGNELKHWCEVLKAENIMRRGAKLDLNEVAKEFGDREIMPDDLMRVFHESGMEELGGLLDLGGGDERGGGQTIRFVTWWMEHLLESRIKTAALPVHIRKRFGIRGILDNLNPRPFDGKPHLFVGTMHSFKGAEADHVYVFPDLSPSGFRAWRGARRDRDGVVRTFYVGMTRAKKGLTICEPSSRDMYVELRSLVRRAKHNVAERTGG